MSFKRMNFGGAVMPSIIMGGMRFERYSTSELKLALGTTIKVDSGEEGTLIEINSNWVVLEVGKFLNKKHREFDTRQITYVPIIEKIYNTKLGKLIKS